MKRTQIKAPSLCPLFSSLSRLRYNRQIFHKYYIVSQNKHWARKIANAVLIELEWKQHFHFYPGEKQINVCKDYERVSAQDNTKFMSSEAQILRDTALDYRKIKTSGNHKIFECPGHRLTLIRKPTNAFRIGSPIGKWIDTTKLIQVLYSGKFGLIYSIGYRRNNPSRIQVAFITCCDFIWKYVNLAN